MRPQLKLERSKESAASLAKDYCLQDSNMRSACFDGWNKASRIANQVRERNYHEKYICAAAAGSTCTAMGFWPAELSCKGLGQAGLPFKKCHL